MKVLIVNKFLYPNGGSETYIFSIGRQLQEMGHEVQYFGMEHEGRCVGNRVDAYTGQVLSGPANVQLSAPVNQSGDIGMEAAKSAALKHAGLSEGQVQELQVEWDNEHGRAVYEVEFKSGGMEYEYVIDAATGSVLEHQAERHD